MHPTTDIASLTLPITLAVAAAASLMGAAFAFGANYFMLRRAVADIQTITKDTQRHSEQLTRHEARFGWHEERIERIERAQEHCPKC